MLDGVFYHTGPAYNVSAALDGPVQTSYHAELKGLAQVVRTHSFSTLIMCDGKSVVDLFQGFFDGRTPATGLQEQDLWDEIFHVLSDLSVSIQWMPSHCSEPGNEAKLAK